MKIKRQNESFIELSSGDIFEHKGVCYIKCDILNSNHNAIKLEGGVPHTFLDDCSVKCVEKNNKITKFEDLNIGDAFLYNNRFYIKTPPMKRGYELDIGTNNYNSVKLSNGSVEEFLNNYLVEKVNGYFELVEEAEK